MDLMDALTIAGDAGSTTADLEGLIGKFHPVDCLIAQHRNCPESYLGGKADFFKWKVLSDEGMRQAYSQRDDLTPWKLRALAQRGGLLTRQRVSKHPNTTEKTRAWIREKFASEAGQVRDERSALLAAKRAILSSARDFEKKWVQYHDLVSEIQEFAAYHPIGWSPVYEAITSTGNEHRTGNLVFAHMFTSVDYSWPHLDGVPLAPLLQLDLRSIAGKSRQSHQLDVLPDMDGLLQVWTTYYTQKTDAIIRFIPGDHVRTAAMTNAAPLLADPNGYLALAGAGFGTGRGLGARIVGWTRQAPKYIHCPWFRNDPWRTGPEDPGQAHKQGIAAGDSMTVAYDDAMTLIEHVRNLVDPVSSHGGSHLFGVSAEFQMTNAWEDLPWQTLYQFDGDGHPDFRIGGYGTASVYWKKDQFRYSWSPYG